MEVIHFDDIVGYFTIILKILQCTEGSVNGISSLANGGLFLLRFFGVLLLELFDVLLFELAGEM